MRSHSWSGTRDLPLSELCADGTLFRLYIARARTGHTSCTQVHVVHRRQVGDHTVTASRESRRSHVTEPQPHRSQNGREAWRRAHTPVYTGRAHSPDLNFGYLELPYSVDGRHECRQRVVRAKVSEQSRPDRPPPPSCRVPPDRCREATLTRSLAVTLCDILEGSAGEGLRNGVDARAEGTEGGQATCKPRINQLGKDARKDRCRLRCAVHCDGRDIGVRATGRIEACRRRQSARRLEIMADGLVLVGGRWELPGEATARARPHLGAGRVTALPICAADTRHVPATCRQGSWVARACRVGTTGSKEERTGRATGRLGT